VAKAIPVVAVPVVAMPVTAKPALKATPKKSKEKTRFQDREEDEDGDENPKKKGGMGLLIGLGAVAVILVAGCGGLGWCFFGQSTTVASTTSTNGGGKPNGWKPIASGDGFAMDTPNGDAGTADAKVNFGGESLEGREYTQCDNGSTIQVASIHCDLKGKALGRYTAGGIMPEMFAMPNLSGSDHGKRFIGGREAAEFVVDRGSVHRGGVVDATRGGRRQAVCLRTTSFCKQVLISGDGFGKNTATYLDVVLDAPPRLTRIAVGNVVDSINLGGHFLISPDDKFAIIYSGIVIDLDKTAGK